MEGGMIVTSESLRGRERLKTPRLTAAVFSLVMTVRWTLSLDPEASFCGRPEANTFVCASPGSYLQDEQDPRVSEKNLGRTII